MSMKVDKTQFVKWVEPIGEVLNLGPLDTVESGFIDRVLPVSSAIERQREYMTKIRPELILSDEDLLMDFITVNWASLEDSHDQKKEMIL